MIKIILNVEDDDPPFICDIDFAVEQSVSEDNIFDISYIAVHSFICAN